MRHLIALVSVILTFFLAPVWAATLPPATCPDVAPIIKAGFLGVQEDKADNLYVAYQLGKYNTPSIWGFIIGVPLDQATTKGDAMNKAKAALVTLTGNPTPQPTDDKNNQWYCLYENEFHYFSAAATPINISNEDVHSVFNLQK